MPVYVAMLFPYYTCMYIACLFCVRVLGLFARVCCLCESLHAFATVCCKVAFRITAQCRLHVRVVFVYLIRSIVIVCLFWSGCVCIYLCMLQACVSCYMCVYCMCVLRSCSLFVCVCMHVLRVIVRAFAVVHCKVAFRVTSVYRFQACFASVLLVRLFVLVCLFCV